MEPKIHNHQDRKQTSLFRSETDLDATLISNEDSVEEDYLKCLTLLRLISIVASFALVC